MRITFDPAFDFGAWPGPLGARAACIEEAWLGPKGLIGQLEIVLGLGGRYLTDDQRAVGLIGQIRKADAFFSRSAEIDPIGTAKKLLAWRDWLCMGGWLGQATSKRLSQLAAVTADVEPGLPDRLRAIACALEARTLHDLELRLFRPTQKLGKLWQTVIASLTKAKVTINEIDLPEIHSKGNLARCRTGKSITPQEDDDSLLLYQPGGILEGAEEVAAWLAEKNDHASPVIIGADMALDRALYRHGLPTTGAKALAHDNPLLAMLPLIMDLAWSPPDPQKAFELLLLRANPTPPTLAPQLAEALRRRPAVNSDYWRKAVEKFLSSVEDKKERQGIEQRLKILFTPTVPRTQRIPAAEIEVRIDTLEAWLRTQRTSEQAHGEAWDAVAAQCQAMRWLIDAAGFSSFSPRELERLIEVAASSVGEKSYFEAQAGIGAVASPGSIVGPADCVIWWGFTLSSVSVPEQLPLNSAERRELSRKGVELPSVSVLAAQATAQWQRPFLMASKNLLLVCPTKTASGEEEFAHPAWDEIKARVHDDSLTYLIERSSLPIRNRHVRQLHTLPKPLMDHTVGRNTIRPRERPESATSLAALLSCPYKYVVEYLAKIRGASGVALAKVSEPLLLGNIAHDLLEMLLHEMKHGRQFTLDTARNAMQNWFETKTPSLASELWLPGNDAIRARLRNIIVAAAGILTTILNNSNLAVLKVEEEEEGVGFGVRLAGRPDAVVGRPAGILDIKWSGAERRRKELKNGVAVQLAVYGSLLGLISPHEVLPVAYFIVSQSRMLSLNGRGFVGGEAIRGPSVHQTYDAMEKALACAWATLQKGEVKALGVGTDDTTQDKLGPGRIDGDTLSLTASCKYCEYGVLCGRMFMEEG